MVRKMMHALSLLKKQVNFLYEKHGVYDLKNPRFLQGKILTELYRDKEFTDSGFQVFSQFGDDGMIQWLVNKIEMPKSFVEFGVENYTESNTRYLLINNNWSGLVIDGSKTSIDYIKADPISLYHDLTAVSAFVTRENINDLLKYCPEPGILSIDIDGNDYWVWKEIRQKPVVVIAEYNAVMGSNPWTVPYDAGFVRGENKQYWGASLKALQMLATEKGYSLIGCNSNGNNAYFIRNDKVGNLEKSFEKAFTPSSFREDFVNGERVASKDRLKLLNGMKVFNVASNEEQVVQL